MDIAFSPVDGVILVSPTGRLDAHSAADFEARLGAEIDGGAKQLVIDGTGLEYLSSAGLRALLGITKKIRTSGGTIALCHLQPQLVEIMEIAGFNSLIPTYPDQAAAVAAAKP